MADGHLRPLAATDPYQRNPFDMALPHSHASGERPGPTLLATFAERVLKNPDEAKRPTIVDKFRGMMKDTDQATERLLRQTADAIFTFDTTTCNETQRKAIMMAKSIAQGDGGEPRRQGHGDPVAQGARRDQGADGASTTS